MGWSTMRERWLDKTAEGPHCLNCATTARMARTDRGFWCDPAGKDPVWDSLARRGVILGERRGCGRLILLEEKLA